MFYLFCQETFSLHCFYLGVARFAIVSHGSEKADVAGAAAAC
jgi:hypothetical protein